jgi:hypothetical protein
VRVVVRTGRRKKEGEEVRSRWRFVLMFVLISRSEQPLVRKLIEKMHGVCCLGRWALVWEANAGVSEDQ